MLHLPIRERIQEPRGDMKGERLSFIYAVDDQDETWYVLIRTGEPPVAAAWPSMLLKVDPEAVMGGTLGSGSPHERTGEVNGHYDDYMARVEKYGRGGGGVTVWQQRGRNNVFTG
jgi:hypothetical protein